MVNTAVSLGVMGIKSVDYITYTFETEKTIWRRRQINETVGVQYLYGNIQVPNNNF